LKQSRLNVSPGCLVVITWFIHTLGQALGFFFCILLHLALLEALKPEQVHAVIVLDSMDICSPRW